jgi:hypothetical protein
MPSQGDITARVARESERRRRLGLPGLAGGVLYLASAILVTATLSALPTVGLVQGLSPALHGQASAVVSPRAGEVKYISHHALPLIAGSTIKSISLIALMLVVLLLLDATRARRPASWPAARALVLGGGIALALVNVAHQVATTVQAHDFAVGHDLSQHAVEQALTKGAANISGQYLDLLAALALTVGMISTSVNAIRVGLLTRWMGVIGIFSAVLIILPIGGATLEIIPAFWLAAMGALFLGRWPGGEPPAWSAGEARPWPSQAELRAQRESQRAAKQAGDGNQAPALSGDVAPAPVQPAANGTARASRRRRRKRGTRR